MNWKEIEPKLSSVLFTAAAASPWIKRCFSQQRQTRLMVCLPYDDCGHIILTANGMKYRDHLNVKGAVVVLERIADLFVPLAQIRTPQTKQCAEWRANKGGTDAQKGV